jgi:hypothetical protein
MSLALVWIASWNYLVNSVPTEASTESLIDSVAREGVAMRHLDELGVTLSVEFKQACQNAIACLEAQPDRPDAPGDTASAFSHCCILPPETVATRFPSLFLWFLQPFWLSLQQRLLNCEAPVICKGINIRKDLPMNGQTGTRLWHVDAEDLEVGKVIVYLDDVFAPQGPFEYIHPDRSAPYRHLRNSWTDDEMARLIPREHWIACDGQAGTTIVTNTARILHHGRSPWANRFVAIATYTSANPANRPAVKAAAFRKGMALLSHRLGEDQKSAILDWDELVA